MIEERWVRTLDLANISRESRSRNVSNDPSGVQSSGFMSRLMDDVESRASELGDGVFIETVLNEFLPDWFRRRGYTDLPDTKPPCFYRMNPVKSIG